MSRGARAFVLAHFIVALVGATALLWYADTLPFARLAAASSAVLGVLWVVGAVMQARLRITSALLLELAAALLVAAAIAS